MDLKLSDIFLMFHYFEPSRAKLWEMTRRYNPIHIAAFLYLLSITRVRKSIAKKEAVRDPITLIESELKSFCNYRVFNINQSLTVDWVECLLLNEDILAERVIVQKPKDSLCNVRSARYHVYDITVLQLIRYLQRCIHGDNGVLRNRFADIIAHNLATKLYQMFLENISFMLFSDNLHSSRGELSDLASRCVVQEYLRFYKMMHHRDAIVEPNKFRFVVIPRPTLVIDRPNELNTVGEYIFQPWYRGFHVIVNTTPTKTRCYNRHAELLQGWLASERYNFHSCFEAIILPTSRCNNTYRSWRYWQYRYSYRIMVVDVLRYEGIDLLNVPFESRLSYISRIRSKHTCVALTSRSWQEIEQLNTTNDDMYSSIRGIIARHKLHVPLGRYDPNSDEIIRQEVEETQPCILAAQLSQVSIFGYIFPVRILGYDLYQRCHILSTTSLTNYRCPHYNLDVAPNSFVVQVYAHLSSRYFICAYNIAAHQFEHVATLRRIESDIVVPRYRAERVYIVGAQVKTRGLLYMRLYFDTRWQHFLGYEHKPTLGKYDVPVDCFQRLLRMAHVLPD
nr:GrBNV gp48-like protein [Apis mellifera nudivirus]